MKPNPLKGPSHVPAQGASTEAILTCLWRQCVTLSEILKEDQQKMADMQRKLNAKMTALKEFATVLNRIPAVLNLYVLVRLSDVSARDSDMLKK